MMATSRKLINNRLLNATWRKGIWDSQGLVFLFLSTVIAFRGTRNQSGDAKTTVMNPWRTGSLFLLLLKEQYLCLLPPVHLFPKIHLVSSLFCLLGLPRARMFSLPGQIGPLPTCYLSQWFPFNFFMSPNTFRPQDLCKICSLLAWNLSFDILYKPSSISSISSQVICPVLREFFSAIPNWGINSSQFVIFFFLSCVGWDLP